MHHSRNNLIAVFFAILVIACNSQGDNHSTNADVKKMDYATAAKKGQEISLAAQSTLLAQVGKAIAAGGTGHAVQYCNIEASGLVDSLNATYDCEISRVTTRRRNPENAIETEYDKRAWNYFSTKTEIGTKKDTVFYARGTEPVYYRPIFIASPTCLKCHGSRSKDIELATLEKIDSLYPADNAVNYVLGDLRGLWKIELQ